jgi:hypothetical protein
MNVVGFGIFYGIVSTSNESLEFFSVTLDNQIPNGLKFFLREANRSRDIVLPPGVLRLFHQMFEYQIGVKCSKG